MKVFKYKEPYFYSVENERGKGERLVCVKLKFNNYKTLTRERVQDYSQAVPNKYYLEFRPNEEKMWRVKTSEIDTFVKENPDFKDLIKIKFMAKVGEGK